MYVWLRKQEYVRAYVYYIGPWSDELNEWECVLCIYDENYDNAYGDDCTPTSS